MRKKNHWIATGNVHFKRLLVNFIFSIWLPPTDRVLFQNSLFFALFCICNVKQIFEQHFSSFDSCKFIERFIFIENDKMSKSKIRFIWEYYVNFRLESIKKSKWWHVFSRFVHSEVMEKWAIKHLIKKISIESEKKHMNYIVVKAPHIVINMKLLVKYVKVFKWMRKKHKNW